MNEHLKNLRTLFNKEINKMQNEMNQTQSRGYKNVLAGKIVGYTEAFNSFCKEMEE